MEAGVAAEVCSSRPPSEIPDFERSVIRAFEAETARRPFVVTATATHPVVSRPLRGQRSRVTIPFRAQLQVPPDLLLNQCGPQRVLSVCSHAMWSRSHVMWSRTIRYSQLI